MIYQSGKTGSRTITVSNAALARYGVSREMKRRGLDDLEEAGLITVRRFTYRNPIVTLL
jgi:hypothetical protein